MNKIFLLLLTIMAILPTVFALDFDQEISSEDKATFDQILEPVLKIYNFVKYTATAIAVLFFIFAGVKFIMSGGDQAQREHAKAMAGYIIVGLVIIWIAPLVVNFLTG